MVQVFEALLLKVAKEARSRWFKWYNNNATQQNKY